MSKIKSVSTALGQFTSEVFNFYENDNRIVLTAIEGKKTAGVFARGTFLKSEITIEYEPEKPKYLKRPDGSLITGPLKGTQICFISDNYKDGYEVYYTGIPDIITYKEGRVFLMEDLELAEKKAQMLTKQIEIKNEIERLNAEQGYEFDTEIENAYFYFDHGDDKVQIGFTEICQSSDLYTYKHIAGQLYKKYSQQELKFFLGIII